MEKFIALLKSTNIRWLLPSSVRSHKIDERERGESVRVANTYLNISPLDLSRLGCLAIFTCIIYISRSRGEDGAPPFSPRPSSTSIQKFRPNFFLFLSSRNDKLFPRTVSIFPLLVEWKLFPFSLAFKLKI